MEGPSKDDSPEVDTSVTRGGYSFPTVTPTPSEPFHDRDTPTAASLASRLSSPLLLNWQI